MHKKESCHQEYMRRCIELAQKAQPQPNPYVGAVIVYNGEIVAEGFHKGSGHDHAEICALKKLARYKRSISIKKAVLYTNLEPCAHFGKTPPCTDVLIKAGIQQVVVGAQDPNKKVNGRGVEKLRKAGVRVLVGVLSEESEAANEQFITFHTKRRPFVALKIASTLDGKVATRNKDSKWITGARARAYARRLRGMYQAVVVGVNTVIYDNPHLGVRVKNKKDPLRIILDTRLRLPQNAAVLRDTHVLIATTEKSSSRRMEAFEKKGIRVVVCREISGMVSLDDFLHKLYDQNIISIFVEGGPSVFSSFLQQGLVDKLYWFSAPKILGDTSSVPAVFGRKAEFIKNAVCFKKAAYKQVGRDMLTVLSKSGHAL